MSNQWLKYPVIQKLFGEKWLSDLKNRTNHPLFQNYSETDYLYNLNNYLSHIRSTKESVINELKNGDQFFDTYYELEIAYFLIQHGLKTELHKIIDDVETDIYIEENKVILEIKHLRIPIKVENASVRFNPKSKQHNSPKDFDKTYMNMERMRSYLNDKKFQRVFPNIVCFCPDIASGECYDIENLLDKSINPDFEIREEISALALWKHQKIKCLFENPNGRKLMLDSCRLKKFFNLRVE